MPIMNSIIGKKNCGSCITY